MNDSSTVHAAPRWATAYDLETSRPLIEQLYKNKTLVEVMDIMESQYGIKATLNMYKKRIKKWGIDKKNKGKEMKAIVRKEKRRSLNGKPSMFRARGRRIEYKDVVRYWERRKMSTEDVLAMCNSRDTSPEGLECMTPIPLPVSLPGVIAIPERILRESLNYTRSSLEFRPWHTAGLTSSLDRAGDERKSWKDLNHLFTQARCAAFLFNKRYFLEAGQTLISATAVIKKILLAEHPLAPAEIMGLFLVLYRLGHSEISNAIMRQIMALGQVVLCHEHPIPKIVALLVMVDYPYLEDIIDRAWCNSGDFLERELGFTHILTFTARCGYWSNMQNSERQGLALRHALQRCSAKLKEPDHRFMMLRLYLSHHYSLTNQPDEAEKVALDVLEHSKQVDTPQQRASLRTEGLYILARVQLLRQNNDAGVAYMSECVMLRTSYFGKQDLCARQMMLTLEELLLKLDQQESAEKVKQRRMTILAAEQIE